MSSSLLILSMVLCPKRSIQSLLEATHTRTRRERQRKGEKRKTYNHLQPHTCNLWHLNDASQCDNYRRVCLVEVCAFSSLTDFLKNTSAGASQTAGVRNDQFPPATLTIILFKPRLLKSDFKPDTKHANIYLINY